MKIVILGGGNMGGAFARACIEQKVCTPKNLLVVEPVATRSAELGKTLGCRIEPAITKTVAAYGLVVLAVKPSEMVSVCTQLKPFLSRKQLIISILAGMKLASIGKALGGHRNVIRCMPNTPAQIGLGMSVYFAPPGVTKDSEKAAHRIFEAAGMTFKVGQEKLIDAATAISGSGPAYVFYFIEHYLKAAYTLGFSPEQADVLVGQTLAGALALWSRSGERPSVLRERVTSKGGTTAAALTVFEARKLGAALVEGIERADQRCRELQRTFKS